MLDFDQSGWIHKDEFVEGILALAFSDVSKEVLLMIRLLQHQRVKSDTLLSKLNIQMETLEKALQASSMFDMRFRDQMETLEKALQESNQMPIQIPISTL